MLRWITFRSYLCSRAATFGPLRLCNLQTGKRNTKSYAPFFPQRCSWRRFSRSILPEACWIQSHQWIWRSACWQQARKFLCRRSSSHQTASRHHSRYRISPSLGCTARWLRHLPFPHGCWVLVQTCARPHTVAILWRGLLQITGIPPVSASWVAVFRPVRNAAAVRSCSGSSRSHLQGPGKHCSTAWSGFDEALYSCLVPTRYLAWNPGAICTSELGFGIKTLFVNWRIRTFIIHCT